MAAPTVGKGSEANSPRKGGGIRRRAESYCSVYTSEKKIEQNQRQIWMKIEQNQRQIWMKRKQNQRQISMKIEQNQRQISTKTDQNQRQIIAERDQHKIQKWTEN